MYLGKDLIVFTKTTKTQSIGLLSQTFLEETGMSEVRVPLVRCSFSPVARLQCSHTCLLAILEMPARAVFTSLPLHAASWQAVPATL